MSAVFVGAGATGGALETVGRRGDGTPPFDGPALGPARPDGAGADAPGGTMGGRGPPPIGGGLLGRGAPDAGGVPAGACGRTAGTPSGAVGTVAAAGGTNGRGGAGGVAAPPPSAGWLPDPAAGGRCPPAGMAGMTGALGDRGAIAGTAGVGRPLAPGAVEGKADDRVGGAGGRGGATGAAAMGDAFGAVLRGAGVGVGNGTWRGVSGRAKLSLAPDAPIGG